MNGQAQLLRVLELSKERGFLGPGDVMFHVEHAARFFSFVDPAASRAIDLGSGGGVPGLILALEFPDLQWNLLDSQAKRCEFLERSTEMLDLDNCVVLQGRAEELARKSELRGMFELVVARSFGAPATTAECASGFLKTNGRLLVSEPPDGNIRWPEDGLGRLGMRLASTSGVAVIEQAEMVSQRYPRRVGIPSKRPLF